MWLGTYYQHCLNWQPPKQQSAEVEIICTNSTFKNMVISMTVECCCADSTVDVCTSGDLLKGELP